MVVKGCKYWLCCVLTLSALCLDTVDAVKNTESNNLTENYISIFHDIQWVFELLYNCSRTIEQFLPNVNDVNDENGSSLANARIILLRGLHHVVNGVKDISSSYLRNAQSNDSSQLREQSRQYISIAAQFVRTLKAFLTHLRMFVSELIQLYSYYMPEILLGKCLGRYITAAHPTRSLYEYPFLLLRDIAESLAQYLKNEEARVDIMKSIDHDENMIIENEISDTEIEESIEAFSADENLTIENVQINPNTTQYDASWQKCFKTFTADFLFRNVKKFFFDVE